MKTAVKSRGPLILAAIVAAAFLLRLLPALPGLLAEDRARFTRPDTATYTVPASTLAFLGRYSGTGRAPGFPAFLAAFYRVQGNNSPFRAIAALLIIGAATAIPVWLAAKLRNPEGGNAEAAVAASLFALNLTAIANAPLLLSDTLFAFVAAWQPVFFLLAYRKNKLFYLIPAAALAALGALIRPVNIVWFLPFAVAVLLMPGKFTWQSKALWCALSLAVFWAIVTPWMLRNAFAGAGFTIDTNTGAMYHQNGAMILAKARGGDFKTWKALLIADETREFADTARYRDEKSRESYRIRGFLGIIRRYPGIWLAGHFSPAILLPDAPALLELLGVTVHGRGTMGVIASRGIIAGVRHYFGGAWGWLGLILPWLIPVLAVYLGAAATLIRSVWPWSGETLYTLVLFLLFSEYYLFLPGPITAPRYQLPALPFLAVMAAPALVWCWRKLFTMAK